MRLPLCLVPALLLAGCAAAGPGPEPQWQESGVARVARDWRTAPPVRWQVQLTGELDLTVDAQVYALDAFSTPAAVVSRLHATGRRVICHVNAGAVNSSDPDAGRFPAESTGTVADRPGQRWLDIRRWETLGPVLTDRFTLCRTKGFDAIAADNVDGYAHASGFPLTARDQLIFNRWLAVLAHGLGLAIGLQNDVDQAEVLEPDFDFAVNEGCFRAGDCTKLEPFVAAGKVVFHVEYDMEPSRFCATAREYGFASMRKNPDLDAWRVSC